MNDMFEQIKRNLFFKKKRALKNHVQLVQVTLQVDPQLKLHEKGGVPQLAEDSCPLQLKLSLKKVQDVVLAVQLPHFAVQGRVPVQPVVIN
ncbi:22799_t:CDS:2 [Racocetra persica]|uniref:22799_t:CDS:1 n=1 Tax=Racocetra persica TaxID=160502 RepID=A0ACA9KIA6_9GLOM|nr:22799_t:CDS:2 [Racocetra persica]